LCVFQSRFNDCHKNVNEEITVMVHSTEDLENAIKASNILFGNSTSDDLKQLDEATFLEVFDVPKLKSAEMKSKLS
jgi:tyrosyl-tRNA synthetase